MLRRPEVRTRASQQAAVAELGQRALAGMGPDEFFELAVDVVARELEADYVSLLELTGDERGLLIRAGHGVPEGVVGGVLSAGEDSLPGYALRSERPLVIEDYARERRFSASPVQQELGVVSAAAAPIGAGGRHFGVLGVHSREAGHFGTDDAHFVQAVANTIGAAVERARSEETVRDSESRFRELADTAPVLMWMTDAEGHVTFVNQGWLRFTGRTLAEELGDSFATSAHPDDRPELLRRWRDALEGQREFRAEYRLRRRDGEYRWMVEVGTPRFADGDFLGYVGTTTDIHERKAMELRLRESEQAFREMADTAPVMLWTTDAVGRVTFVNQGWLRYTGQRGEPWALGIHPHDADDVLASWLDALTARAPWEREYRLRREDGQYRWVAVRAVPRWEDDELTGYVGTATDIHERKSMEERLRRVYETEHEIAATLQRSLLPKRLPAIDGLELAARYLPAAKGAAVGGDWYDAMELKDGRVALVVGDVVGHGLRAAAVMGQLRNAARAYALVETSPAEVMARLNRLLVSGEEDAMATVLLLVLDRETGDAVFTNAGHPPPLMLAPHGTQYLEGGRSVPVGATDLAVFRESTATIPAGSSLLLYTDGLVERRDVPLEDRLGQLAAAASAAGGELQDVCDQVLAGVLGQRDPADDVAVLAVRPQPAASETVSVIS